LAQQAEKILRKMEQLWQRGDDQVEPTNRHFNVVINAYAKSTDPFAARKAYDLLQRMKGGNFRSKPDIITYTTVIECFSKSADPDASEIVLKLLQEAFAMHEQTGDPALRPNARTFTMVIRTLAESNGSVEVARKLLTQMVDMYEETKDEALMPNTYPYNYVLNCAANTLEDDKMQAFKIATKTYQDMRTSEYVRPDSFTYAFWFKCCNNLIKDNPELKEKCMFYAFDECRKEGLVSNTVLNRLQHGVPPAVLEEWVGIPKRKNGFWDLKITELPEEWSRNAQ
jgi:PPR repeat